MYNYNVHLDEKHLTLTIRNYTKFQLWYIKVKSGTNDRSTVEQKKKTIITTILKHECTKNVINKQSQLNLQDL